MRKLQLTVLLLISAGLLSAQSIPLREVNFEEARISVAGPEAFYVRNVGFHGERYAVVVGRSEGGEWTVTDLYAESENLSPRELILDFAAVRLEGDDTLVLDGIFVNGSVYQGRLQIGDDDRAQLAEGFRASSLEALDPLRLRKLRETILETVAPVYEERISLLQEELRSARAQINQQKLIIDELDRENDGLEEELALREGEIVTLQERVATLEEELTALAKEEPRERSTPSRPAQAPGISELDLSRVEQDIRALRQEADTLATLLTELIRENGRLRRSLDEAREELAAGNRPPLPTPEPSRISESAPAPREIATATDLLRLYQERLTSPLLEGFDSGRARMGSWEVQKNLALQTDPGEYFSRYALPLEQLEEPTLFSFRGRSVETKEWTGFGLHLFASSVEARNGYGHGESLLIWFTRDREHYGTDHTYLQIYRSTDDITMDRVAGGIIPEVITSPLDVEILYQPEVGDITIAVGGEVRLLYKGWFGIDSGMEIALRTKGRGRFESLQVRTAPEK